MMAEKVKKDYYESIFRGKYHRDHDYSFTNYANWIDPLWWLTPPPVDIRYRTQGLRPITTLLFYSISIGFFSYLLSGGPSDREMYNHLVGLVTEMPDQLNYNNQIHTFFSDQITPNDKEMRNFENNPDNSHPHPSLTLPSINSDIKNKYWMVRSRPRTYDPFLLGLYNSKRDEPVYPFRLTPFEVENHIHGPKMLTITPQLRLTNGSTQSEIEFDYTNLRKYLTHESVIIARYLEELTSIYRSGRLPAFCYGNPFEPYSRTGRFSPGIDSDAMGIADVIRDKLTLSLSPLTIYQPNLGLLPKDVSPTYNHYPRNEEHDSHISLLNNISVLQGMLGGLLHEISIEQHHKKSLFSFLSKNPRTPKEVVENAPKYLATIQVLRDTTENLYTSIYNAGLWQNSTNSLQWHETYQPDFLQALEMDQNNFYFSDLRKTIIGPNNNLSEEYISDTNLLRDTFGSMPVNELEAELDHISKLKDVVRFDQNQDEKKILSLVLNRLFIEKSQGYEVQFQSTHRLARDSFQEIFVPYRFLLGNPLFGQSLTKLRDFLMLNEEEFQNNHSPRIGNKNERPEQMSNFASPFELFDFDQKPDSSFIPHKKIQFLWPFHHNMVFPIDKSYFYRGILLPNIQNQTQKYKKMVHNKQSHYQNSPNSTKNIPRFGFADHFLEDCDNILNIISRPYEHDKFNETSLHTTKMIDLDALLEKFEPKLMKMGFANQTFEEQQDQLEHFALSFQNNPSQSSPANLDIIDQWSKIFAGVNYSDRDLPIAKFKSNNKIHHKIITTLRLSPKDALFSLSDPARTGDAIPLLSLPDGSSYKSLNGIDSELHDESVFLPSKNMFRKNFNILNPFFSYNFCSIPDIPTVDGDNNSGYYQGKRK
jgi:hypothetical protein